MTPNGPSNSHVVLVLRSRERVDDRGRFRPSEAAVDNFPRGKGCGSSDDEKRLTLEQDGLGRVRLFPQTGQVGRQTVCVGY